MCNKPVEQTDGNRKANLKGWGWTVGRWCAGAAGDQGTMRWCSAG